MCDVNNLNELDARAADGKKLLLFIYLTQSHFPSVLLDSSWRIVVYRVESKR